MPTGLALANAFWIFAFIGGKLDGEIAWGWWPTCSVAFAPFALIALGCWWAAIYDQSQQP